MKKFKYFNASNREFICACSETETCKVKPHQEFITVSQYNDPNLIFLGEVKEETKKEEVKFEAAKPRASKSTKAKAAKVEEEEVSKTITAEEDK